MAEALAKVTGADLHEIIPEVPYSDADLDWHDPRSRSSVEMSNLSSRPALAGAKSNHANYDVFFVGFPIWWGIAPTIINTFLESYNFSDKTIVPFATSGGSGIGKSAEKLRGSVNATARVLEGRLLNGNPSADELAAWVAGLGV